MSYIPDEKICYAFKIVILGSGGVGKTCLFNRYCFNSFNVNTDMTIGINFHSTYLKARFEDNNSKYIVNSIFDFGGQERFKPLIPKFLEGASGAFLVFDSVGFTSFNQLDYWYDTIFEYAGDSKIPKILIGSKSDLLDETAKVEIIDDELINKFIKDKKLDGFHRTSALENYNVIEVFKNLTNLMLKKSKVNAVVL